MTTHEVVVLCKCDDIESCTMERYVSDVRILAAQLPALGTRAAVRTGVMGSPPRRPTATDLFSVLDFLADSAEYLNGQAVANQYEWEQLKMAMENLRASNSSVDTKLTALQDAVATQLGQMTAANDRLAQMVRDGATPEQLQTFADEQNARAARIQAAVDTLSSDDPVPTP